MDSKKSSDINENVRPAVFKQYEDGFIVRGMSKDEARIVQKWYCGMGKISRYDLDTCLAVFPPGPGFYIGELNGQVVSSCVRLPWGDGHYYGSYYYVDDAYRGKGYGTRLRDEVAYGHVLDAKGVLSVDAVGGKVEANNISKFGYKHAWKTRRYEGTAKSDQNVQLDGTIEKATGIPFDEVFAYDSKCFVSRDYPVRGEFMRRWIDIPGGAAYVAKDRDGKVVGLGCRHPCIQERNHIIGPLYADNAAVAEALFHKLCAEVAGELVTINVWVPNQEAVDIITRSGMEMVFELNRMHANGDPDTYKPQVFALTSIDVCGF